MGPASSLRQWLTTIWVSSSVPPSILTDQCRPRRLVSCRSVPYVTVYVGHGLFLESSLLVSLIGSVRGWETRERSRVVTGDYGTSTEVNRLGSTSGPVGTVRHLYSENLDSRFVFFHLLRRPPSSVSLLFRAVHVSSNLLMTTNNLH